jgi:hypothetical protein
VNNSLPSEIEKAIGDFGAFTYSYNSQRFQYDRPGDKALAAYRALSRFPPQGQGEGNSRSASAIIKALVRCIDRISPNKLKLCS